MNKFKKNHIDQVVGEFLTKLLVTALNKEFNLNCYYELKSIKLDIFNIYCDRFISLENRSSITCFLSGFRSCYYN